MDCQKIENILIDYIDGILDLDMQQKVEEHLTACKSCRQVFEQNKQLISDMENIRDEIPDISLKDDFYAMLKKEKTILKKEDSKVVPMRTNVVWIAMKYAAAILVIFSVGMFLGRNLQWKSQANIKVAELRQEVYTMQQNYSLASLSQSTASQRIKAIDIIDDMLQPDETVITALIHTLNHDDNTNVKMAAVSALSRYPENTQVKDAFVEALKNQNDPIIQITLINVLIQIQDDRAKDILKQLIADEDVIPTVKEQAEVGLKVFI